MLTDTGRTRGMTFSDLNDEVQQVVGWVAEKYEETGLWPNQAWVWREIARRGLHHEIVVREGNQVFDHLGSPPSEKDFVRLRPWVLYDTGRCRQSFVRAYEVYRDIQGRLQTEESVTVTRKELGAKYKLPFASKELHQLVWVLSCGFSGRCDGNSTDTDWTFTFSLGFLKSPPQTLEEVFLRRPELWIPEPEAAPALADQSNAAKSVSVGATARRANLAEDVDSLAKLLYDRARNHEDEPQQGWLESEEIARLLGWKPPRLNKAFNVLEKRGWLDVDERIGSAPYDAHAFQLNEEGILAYERPTDQGQSDAEDSATTAPDPRKVFVIHGRNARARDEMEHFLQSLGLHPLRFGNVRASLGGTPTIAEVVERGMDEAQGVIALFTADEYAGVRPEYREQHDKPEDVCRWQARPNVIFEAGMAFGRDRRRVVFVLLGSPELCTDLAGIHVLRPTNDADPKGHRAVLRQTLMGGMGCLVDPDMTEWMTAGDFVACVAPDMADQVLDPFGGASDVSAEGSHGRLSNDGLEHLTPEAGGLLRGIGQMYVAEKYPNRAVWKFSPQAGQDATFAELRAHGLIETIGTGNHDWRLTPDGLTTILAISRGSSANDSIADQLAVGLEEPPRTSGSTSSADVRGKLLAALEQRARLDPAGNVNANLQDIATEIGTTPNVAHEIILALRDEGEMKLLSITGGPKGVFLARIPMRRS